MADRGQVLIGRLEKASEGSRALSDEVLLCVGWIKPAGDDYWFKPDGCIFHHNKSRPDPTRSLDAAMTLVPDCHDWYVQQIYGMPFEGSAWKGCTATVGKHPVGGPLGNERHRGDAPTPALALVIAALKSRLPHPAKES